MATQNIPRSEYPRPQLVRSDWQNLNGKWQFCFDNGRSGIQRKLYDPEIKLESEITVPFCPQSELSGINHKDFIYGMWYKREFTLDKDQVNGRTVIHFGAVDYTAVVFINGKEAGRHTGGYVSFEFDITDLVTEGVNTVAVYAEDDERDPLIPRGKQCEGYYSAACDYTRTSGIWQTVWLEFKPQSFIKKVKYYPDLQNTAVAIEVEVSAPGTLKAEISFEGRIVAEAEVSVDSTLRFTMPLAEAHPWELGKGALYDVTLKFGEDTVNSYFGLREVALRDGKFYLNGKSVFQRLVLDQGFYPDGIYTAPSDEALKNDILLSMKCGFNGARLHEKVFEERFLYHCDKLGYMVWGEYADWGADVSNPLNIYSFLPEWISEVKRDFNHPAIIGWCPHNETWDYHGRQQHNESIRMLYKVTKALDNTRPCIDTSGNYHVETDIFDVHDYCQKPEEFKEHYDKLMTENVLFDNFKNRQTYRGEPVMVSEYGGIRWSEQDEGKTSWGYGGTPETVTNFIERFKGLTDALLDNDRIFGFCYTQLTDVEQEQNGLYTYSRKAKFDTELLHSIISRKAKIED